MATITTHHRRLPSWVVPSILALVAIALVAVGLSLRDSRPVADTEARSPAVEAAADRYQGLADWYAEAGTRASAERYEALAEAYRLERANAAVTERLEGLASTYVKSQAAIDAEAARWTALAGAYGLTPTAQQAWAERLEGLADTYRGLTEAQAAEAARYEGLAEYYGK